jgi:hypothetical protein
VGLPLSELVLLRFGRLGRKEANIAENKLSGDQPGDLSYANAEKSTGEGF